MLFVARDFLFLLFKFSEIFIQCLHPISHSFLLPLVPPNKPHPKAIYLSPSRQKISRTSSLKHINSTLVSYPLVPSRVSLPLVPFRQALLPGYSFVLPDRITINTPYLLHILKTVLVFIFSCILNCNQANQRNPIITA